MSASSTEAKEAADARFHAAIGLMKVYGLFPPGRGGKDLLFDSALARVFLGLLESYRAKRWRVLIGYIEDLERIAFEQLFDLPPSGDAGPAVDITAAEAAANTEASKDVFFCSSFHSEVLDIAAEVSSLISFLMCFPDEVRVERAGQAMADTIKVKLESLGLPTQLGKRERVSINLEKDFVLWLLRSLEWHLEVHMRQAGLIKD